MKRTLFRLSVLGLVIGLGLLAIAHAQRPAVPPPQDEPAANPLRQDSFPRGDIPPADYRGQEAGPVDTAPAPDENPLRRQPRRDPKPEAEQPTRIRLVAGEDPADTRSEPTAAKAAGPFLPTQRSGQSPDSPLRASSNEPQLMPADDRYVIPSRTGEAPKAMQPMPSPATSSATSPNAAGREGVTFRAVGLAPEPASQGSDGQGSPAYNGTSSPTYRPSVAARESDSATAASGAGQPGDKQLEGPQTAQIVLQKIAPREIQVGRPAVLRTVVRNAGSVAAAEVEVRDQIPRGTRLLGTSPTAAQGRGGELVWSLGALKPGGETTVEMQIVPTDEGEVGSVASVRFQTAATARSVVTRPKLVVQTAGPKTAVLAGDEAVLTFTVSNPGSGVATGVTLIEHIPAGLKHSAGPELEYSVGDLKPGESRQLQLHLKAVQAGTITNVITAKADANLHAEHRFNLEVASAKLDLALNGPKRRYLEREATYQFSIANPGNAPAKQVELVAYLPEGLKFVSANNSGHFDANTRAVYWQMDELPVNQQGTVELVTLPIAQGQFNLKVRSAAQRGLAIEKEQPVVVEGLAAVAFQLSHTKDPLEVGGETTYEISVINQGSKDSTNLQMAVFLPAELRPLAAEGPTRYTIQDNKVVFEGLPQLKPKSVAAFRVRAQGVRAGDLRVRCQLQTDEMQRPVVKEESTRVYADE